jgi:hypothetical protein
MGNQGSGQGAGQQGQGAGGGQRGGTQERSPWQGQQQSGGKESAERAGQRDLQGAFAAAGDQGSRFGAMGQSAQSQGQGGEETTRYLDAIEQNVNKLRNSVSGAGRSGESEADEGREGRSTRGEREETGSESDRDL